jgi:signal transduction histidine kinase
MEQKYIVELFVTGTCLLIVFAFTISIYLLVTKRKQNQYYLEKQQLQKALLAESQRTMNEIAEEIHDHLAQILSMAQMTLKAACDVPGAESCIPYMQKADSLLSEIGDRLQVINKSLHSEYIKQRGVLGVLHAELEYLSLNYNTYCHLEIAGTKINLPSEKNC